MCAFDSCISFFAVEVEFKREIMMQERNRINKREREEREGKGREGKWEKEEVLVK